MEINKFYGPKPSYRIMKNLMKEDNSTSFYQHGMNLVYYCIKHNFTEEQVIEYLDKMCDKCTKYLNNHDPNIYERIPIYLIQVKMILFLSIICIINMIGLPVNILKRPKNILIMNG